MNLGSLTSLQLDALREVGGIGGGHAATALAQLVDRPVTLEVPKIEIMGFDKVPAVFGGPERLAGAVFCRIHGDLSGGVMFMAGRESVLALCDLMQGREPGTGVALGHEQEEQFRRAASMLITAYLAAVARMADLSILPSDPSGAFDMAGALLEAVVAEAGLRADHAVFISSSFVDSGHRIDAALFFVPDPDGLDVLLGRLGMVG